jgi:putative oxidoreductase
MPPFFLSRLSIHAHVGDQNHLIHFLKNLAIASGFLYVVAFGAGCFSLDAWLAKKSQT